MGDFSKVGHLQRKPSQLWFLVAFEGLKGAVEMSTRVPWGQKQNMVVYD